MENNNFLAVDLGNSWYKVLAADNGSLAEYELPNAIALFDEEFYEKYYDEEDVKLEENLIVEVKSEAISAKREIYYAGKSATRQRNVSLTSFNNQKVEEDRTFILLFSATAFHAIQQSPNETDIFYEIDQLAVSLPTTQYKEKKELLKKKLKGTHTIILHKVPMIQEPKEIVVKIQVNDVIVGAEGACAYLGLTRDLNTLEIKDEDLVKDSKKGVIIGDLGGDSVDFVGIKNNRPVASIEGETFGINLFLDHIIKKVSKNELFKFDSRSELEEKLCADVSEWYVEPFAGVRKDISKYVIPQLKTMAIKYLELFDQIRSSSTEIKGSVKYIAVGGAAKLAKKQIQEAALKWNQKGRPIELMFPENLEKLNVQGLLILAKMNHLKKQSNSRQYVTYNR
ncbi:ParM/StbA family protein [Anaerobacillus sp. CMMVII]|uniref:ParM/StbA family protein n=1 Tax=Anaerobacillus sp. CMMVII TaxID=2755588 RepID=UPI0021B745EA|nr:ParM/StbA family protein [Anaerobacillus sp. CMMVII]MCT8138287.1 ParM/StbA family protein [Anaerobacillus sp. CMMVII]